MTIRLLTTWLTVDSTNPVDKNKTDELIQRISEEYYHPRNLPVGIEVCFPVAGAGVIDVLIFDPLEEYLEPSLQGHRLAKDCMPPFGRWWCE